MSHVMDLPDTLREIDAFKAKINDHFVTFNPADVDEQFESNGVPLFVDPLSYQYLDGTEIDYVEGAHGSGFKFGNPNVTSTCGCGSSFNV